MRWCEITQEGLPPTPSSPSATPDGLAETLRAHRSFEIDKVSFADAVYEDTTGQCPLDLGVQLGRMRLTERLGGYHQPKLVRFSPLWLSFTYNPVDSANRGRITCCTAEE